MLRLAAAARSAILEAATAAYPDEACGLLIGTAGRAATLVARAVAGRNVAAGRLRDRYTLDPRDLLAGMRAARAAGLEIVGVWHSHPDHPARPSAADRANAWPGWSYLIAASTAAGAGEVRSWRLAGERFVEEEIAR